MNLQEKVEKIVSYCGKYLGHKNMVFERIESLDFNVEFFEERLIKENLSRLKIIILTGEAGDGKSHLLNNLKSHLTPDWNPPCEDFSALPKENQKELILNIESSIENNFNQKYIIAANIGILMNKILEHAPSLLKKLQNANDNIKVINFENRNIAGDSASFKDFILKFLYFDRDCENISCSHYDNCIFRFNIENLKKSETIDSLRALCNAIFLMGGHLTVRELLSLISFMITHGKKCADMQVIRDVSYFTYYNIFDDNKDILLKKFYSLDPAKQRVPSEFVANTSKCEIIKLMREKYFTSNERDKFSLLPVLYLTEFQKFLISLRKEGYVDIKENNDICNKLKYGLLKIISKEHSFGEIILQDTPNYLGENIKIQFEADFNKINLIWSNISFDLGQEPFFPDKNAFSENKMFLSCVYGEDNDDKMIKLLVDYNAFKYVLMHYENYYTYSEGFSNVEYGFNDFFIKILNKHPDFYNKMSVIFDRKLYGQYIDFDLEIYKSKLKKEEKIILRKRDRRV